MIILFYFLFCCGFHKFHVCKMCCNFGSKCHKKDTEVNLFHLAQEAGIFPILSTTKKCMQNTMLNIIFALNETDWRAGSSVRIPVGDLGWGSGDTTIEKGCNRHRHKRWTQETYCHLQSGCLTTPKQFKFHFMRTDNFHPRREFPQKKSERPCS